MFLIKIVDYLCIIKVVARVDQRTSYIMNFFRIHRLGRFPGIVASLSSIGLALLTGAGCDSVPGSSSSQVIKPVDRADMAASGMSAPLGVIKSGTAVQLELNIKDKYKSPLYLKGARFAFSNAGGTSTGTFGA